MDDSRWIKLTEALRRNWPNLTDADFESTGRSEERIRALLKAQGHQDVDKKLDEIWLETQEGNPETIDRMAGIERAQESNPPRPSNEWKAREESNRNTRP